jgi:hypothetical protein
MRAQMRNEYLLMSSLLKRFAGLSSAEAGHTRWLPFGSFDLLLIEESEEKPCQARLGQDFSQIHVEKGSETSIIQG